MKVELEDCFGFDANVWRDVLGGCEATLDVAGAKSCRLRIISGGGDGDTSASATAWWQDGDGDSIEPPE